MRSSGILLPIFSLPSKYGIGSFSKEAYEFVDMLAQTGQRYWQLLPLGPTGYGDSPYQSFSTFAGNPYFIDLEFLAQEGLLTSQELEEASLYHIEGDIRYDYLYETRFKTLCQAFKRQGITKEIEDFIRENNHWLGDYCLYMALKDYHGGAPWYTWEEKLKRRHPDVLEHWRLTLEDDIHFYEWQQYHFHKQWYALKEYANNKGILMIGDIPIYVAMDSADTWQHPEKFWFDEDLVPIKVAGCPPDAFSALGQLWGNPLYRWDVHEKEGYAWWIERMKSCFGLYDCVRIDHFRAFDGYYAIPYGEDTAVNGKWEKGPGIGLFQKMKEALGDVDIIAEDLGHLTQSVLDLRQECGFPGMNILCFGFDADADNPYLPFRYSKNSVAYTGTHDNQTVRSWYEEGSEHLRYMVGEFFQLDGRPVDIALEMVRTVMESNADRAIIPLQDYMGLDDRARINQPSTLGTNWRWRLRENEISDATKERIRRLTYISGRKNKECR